MTTQDVRNEIIRENLPKLIKNLTGCKNDSKLRRCEQYAWLIIRNHRNLSTNSHEVRRTIDGIKEKFFVDNLKEYADYLDHCCNEIINHPLCKQHYELDVQWSLLDFLLALAYNPSGALRHNKHKLDLNQCLVFNNKENEKLLTKSEYLKDILKEDFISTVECQDSDSELSEWSDDVSVEQAPYQISAIIPKEKKSSSAKKTIKCFSNIKPPNRQKSYISFSSFKSENFLFKHVQNTWWLQHVNKSQAYIESQRMEASFAIMYSRFLSDTSNNLILLDEPTTVAELCLIREVLWMFHSPENCKFFEIDDTHNLKVRVNVTIPSAIAYGLSSFLKVHILPYIRMMHSLRKFLSSIYINEEFTPPKTVECYAANLNALLTPIWKKINTYEECKLTQRNYKVNTIINLQNKFHNTFKLLECIYVMHQNIVLNLHQYPAHICSAYLLSRLMCCNELASNAMESNLAISLFLSAVKIFCMIIDTWWMEGRLDDWQNEFIVERVNNCDHNICVRQYYKSKEMAFFVPANVSKVITESRFFRLLLDHSLEAGHTLNLLYEINRIGDLKNTSNAIEGELYNVFIDDVMKHIHSLQSELKVNSPVSETDVSFISTAANSKWEPDYVQWRENTNDDLQRKMTTTDEFLLLAFTTNTETECENDTKEDMPNRKKPTEITALDIYQELQQMSPNHILPFEEIIFSSLSRILKTRIAFANSFVMKLYRTEFSILEHLRNIRKVLLLAASDLMHQFYGKLFKQIETERSWANPFTLTMQLDDILCSKFPELSSLFRLEINSVFRCQTNKVYEAVDELTITYNFSRELTHIITPKDIQDYNIVFRFLLKIKWALMTLENMRFPHSRKRRKPYSPFEMIDLLMRRLEQLRFWMIYAMQNVHSHLMTHVLQSMGDQLDEKISKCTNLKEMQTVHKSYLSTVCEHCFLSESFSSIKIGIEQLLNLVFILCLEWNSCIKYIENSGPLAVDITDSYNEDPDNDYVANAQIDEIEQTYIQCHQYLANKFNNEVYLKQRGFLSGISAAFNTSLPI